MRQGQTRRPFRAARAYDARIHCGGRARVGRNTAAQSSLHRERAAGAPAFPPPCDSSRPAVRWERISFERWALLVASAPRAQGNRIAGNLNVERHSTREVMMSLRDLTVSFAAGLLLLVACKGEGPSSVGGASVAPGRSVRQRAGGV